MATKSTDINIEEEDQAAGISNMEQGHHHPIASNKSETNQLSNLCSSTSLVTTMQKLIAEIVGTCFIIFAGCGSVAVNKIDGSITFPCICVTWGLIVMVMIYSVGHVSGAHFNPAVTITFAIFCRFPFKQVPLYIAAQLMGSILASATLALLLDVTPSAYFGTLPVGSHAQSFAAEIIISFLLMFAISGATTDDRAVGELRGITVGMTIMLNALDAGSSLIISRTFSGASMNPARSVAPALVKGVYNGLWIYIIGPIIGTIARAFSYNLMRFTNKSLCDLTMRNP